MEWTLNMRCFLFAVMLLGSVVAAAESPKAVISGPTGGVPGDIILLDASGSTGDYFKWAVSRELPDGRQTLVVVSESGKKVVIASLPGQHEIWLAVGNKDGVDLLKYVVTISGGPSPRPDVVIPEPVPGPQFPDSRLGVSKKIFEAAKLVSGASGEASGLARSFRGVVAQISARTLTGKSQIMEALKVANNQVLNTPDKWERWGRLVKSTEAEAAVIPKVLSGLAADGKLSSDDDFKVVFSEIAVGLEAVK